MVEQERLEAQLALQQYEGVQEELSQSRAMLMERETELEGLRTEVSEQRDKKRKWKVNFLNTKERNSDLNQQLIQLRRSTAGMTSPSQGHSFQAASRPSFVRDSTARSFRPNLELSDSSTERDENLAQNAQTPPQQPPIRIEEVDETESVAASEASISPNVRFQ